MGERMLSPVSIETGEEDYPTYVTLVCNNPGDCERRTRGKFEKTANLEYVTVSFLCLNLSSS